MSEPEYEHIPIEFYGRAGYDAAGQLTYVEVGAFGHQPVVAHPNGNESVGDVFERAYEGAKTLLVTKRPATTQEPTSEVKP